MVFWRSPAGFVLVLALGAAATCAGALGIRVWNVCHPPRVPDPGAGIAFDLARIEETRFEATDGVAIDAWILRGEPGRSPIVIAHDLGSAKSELINLAIALQDRGFTVVAFDFRGHGTSARVSSTLGVLEKRDVLGAVDFATSLPDVDAGRVGVFGTGMGAHAAALAAADRPVVRVLVLDGVVPDAEWILARRVAREWIEAWRALALPSKLTFRLIAGTASDGERAADVLPRLFGRDIVLVAPSGDPALATAIESLFRSLPEERGCEANLVTLPEEAAGVGSADRGIARDARIASFFAARLGPRS